VHLNFATCGSRKDAKTQKVNGKSIAFLALLRERAPAFFRTSLLLETPIDKIK
jgi:hypothetical protein